MTVTVGPRVPRRGNAFSRWLGHAVLRLLGWRLVGSVPDHPRMVVIGAPHTSNFDGVLALATLTALGMRASTMIKDTAFKGVMGPLLRWFGALPINRRSPKGVVEQSIDAFADGPRLLLIAPEGTRHAVAEWKRGFYRIAEGAGVPILPAAVHYARREIAFGPALQPSGDYDADLRTLMTFYRAHAWPRHPERLSKPMSETLGQAWSQAAADRRPPP